MITQISDYSSLDSDVKNKILFDFFRESQDFLDVLSSFNSQFNELEEVAFQLANNLLIDNATGVNLDVLGKILGLPRFGRDDESYRSLLQLKTDINIGSGTPELVIQAITILYGATIVNFIPNYPGKVNVEQNGQIGLFILSNLTTISGNNLVTLSGDNIVVRAPDATGEVILENLMPAGTLLTIVNI